jgi:hypothetical protein
MVCLAHPNMTATIHVLVLSTPLAHDQASYDKEAKRERAALLSDVMASAHNHSGPNEVTAGVGHIIGNGGGTNRQRHALHGRNESHPCWRNRGVDHRRGGDEPYHHLWSGAGPSQPDSAFCQRHRGSGWCAARLHQFDLRCCAFRIHYRGTARWYWSSPGTVERDPLPCDLHWTRNLPVHMRAARRVGNIRTLSR